MIRKATPNDARNIAKLIILGWQTAYKGLIDDEFLNNNFWNKILTSPWRHTDYPPVFGKFY